MSAIQPGQTPKCPINFKAFLPKTAPQTDPPAADPQDTSDPAGLGEKLHDPRGKVIPCPWWRTVINSDLVKVAPDGNVSMKDLSHALKATGVTFALREAALLGIKKVACQMAGVSTGGIMGFVHVLTMDKINVLDLPKSSLMHTGDSGTLRGGFHQENLERLLSYSSDGKTITQNDLAAANKKQVEADPGESGHKFGVAEYSILLNVFGHKNEAGEKFLSKEDATTIFKDNEFPKDWEKNNVGFISLGKSIVGMFRQQKQDA